MALSAQISTVCRGAYAVVPMHVIDAPVAASGKSYLLSTVSCIATGQAMPVIGAGKNEEEMEKRLGAAVIQGQPLICLDNVIGELGGDALCRLIEQPRPSVRVLGQSQNCRGRCPSSHVLRQRQQHRHRRRPVPARGSLPPRSADGAARAEDFKGDPMQDILANRGNYIAAALTICRAYIAAGRPNQLPQLASFGEWSDTVRSALVWLGEADPVDVDGYIAGRRPRDDRAGDHADRVESGVRHRKGERPGRCGRWSISAAAAAVVMPACATRSPQSCRPGFGISSTSPSWGSGCAGKKTAGSTTCGSTTNPITASYPGGWKHDSMRRVSDIHPYPHSPPCFSPNFLTVRVLLFSEVSKKKKYKSDSFKFMAETWGVDGIWGGLSGTSWKVALAGFSSAQIAARLS